jgi:hypothetical protein
MRRHRHGRAEFVDPRAGDVAPPRVRSAMTAACTSEADTDVASPSARCMKIMI